MGNTVNILWYTHLMVLLSCSLRHFILFNVFCTVSMDIRTSYTEISALVLRNLIFLRWLHRMCSRLFAVGYPKPIYTVFFIF